MKHIILLLLLTVIPCSCVTEVSANPVSFKDITVFVRVESSGVIQSTGSGVVIEARNSELAPYILILTAKHVVEDIETKPHLDVIAELDTGSFMVDTIYMHPDQDIALLACSAARHQGHAILDDSFPVPLKEVYSSGFPAGLGLVITYGLINYQVPKDFGSPDELPWICTAPSFLGGSGGGVFNKDDGKLTGITIMIGTHGSGFSRSIVAHIHLFVPVCRLIPWIRGVQDERQKAR